MQFRNQKYFFFDNLVMSKNEKPTEAHSTLPRRQRFNQGELFIELHYPLLLINPAVGPSKGTDIIHHVGVILTHLPQNVV